jgi:hypothetical protein
MNLHSLPCLQKRNERANSNTLHNRSQNLRVELGEATIVYFKNQSKVFWCLSVLREAHHEDEYIY